MIRILKTKLNGTAAIASLSERLSRFWVAADLNLVEQRRARRGLLLSSLMVLMIGVGWALFFAWRGEWKVFALDVVIMLAVLALNGHKQVRTVSIAMFLTLIGVLTLICLVYDVPTPQLQRASHFHLLPLSVMALMAFRDESLWLRHGIALTCLAVFVLLDIDPGISPPTYRLPDDIREISLWVHPVTAFANLYILLYLMQTDAIGRSRLENDLRTALLEHRFALHHQAQVDANGHVVGAEALLRWMHPRRGLLRPADFILLAEKTDLLLPINQWALEAACIQLQAWSDYHITRHLSLAVSVSGKQLHQSDFVAQVLALIDRYHFEPNRLELELTEATLTEDLQDVVAKMSMLRAHGVRFSLADFGTGSSSLNYLKQLPLDKLKIDPAFMRELLTDSRDAAIVRTVVALGQSLGLTVMAAGVDTEGQRRFLVDLGCKLFQGHLYGAPAPIAGFNTFVAQHRGA